MGNWIRPIAFGRSNIFLFGAAVLVSGLVWDALNAQRTTRIDRVFEAEALHQIDLLKANLQLQIVSVEHLAALKFSLPAPTDEALAEDIKSRMASVQGLRSVTFDDAANQRKLLLLAPDISAFQRAMAGSAAPAVMATDKPILHLPDLSNAVAGGTDRKDSLLVFLPVTRNGNLMGTMGAQFDARDALTKAQFPLYRIEMTPGTPELVGDGDKSELSLSRSVDLFNSPITVTVLAGPDLVSKYFNWLPETVAALVLLCLGGLVQAIRLINSANFAEMRAQAANERLRRNNDRLLLEIEDRKQAEHRAEVARLATSRFLTTMSHEIRTPLNAIMGMFQLIAKAQVPERQKRQAAGGLAAAERLFRELCNVLDVSQLDAGAMSVSPRAVPAVALFGVWRTLLEGLVQKSGRALSAQVDIAADIPDTLRVDEIRLTQIVTNLMDNAVKFTEQGAVGLDIRLDPTRPDGLEFRVWDSGPGIPANRKAQVFQRFYQVEDGLNRRHEGSGLGLSICSELAELMGGRLYVEDRENGGSIFSLKLSTVLPCGEAQDPSPAQVHREGAGVG